MKKQSQAGKIIGNIIFYTLVVILMFLVLSQFGVLPFRLMYLETGSMAPVYQPGDAVFVYTAKSLTVQPGDVIYFHAGSTPVVHRVVSIDPDGIVTRGDANDGIDSGKIQRAEGKVLFGIPKIGYAINWVQMMLFRLIS